MSATMTWVGLDVHARSTHGAAIDRESGELTRARFGGGVEEVVGWLESLPQPVYGCYEAGPTGYALYRAAETAGLRVDVVAPSKTPRRRPIGSKPIARTPNCSCGCSWRAR
jgi:transposase